MSDRPELWLSERYWPGLTAELAGSTMDALRAACAELGASSTVELIEGAWLPEDEVLTARFAGTKAGVVAAHEMSGASFDRLTRVVDLDRRDERSKPTGRS